LVAKPFKALPYFKFNHYIAIACGKYRKCTNSFICPQIEENSRNLEYLGHGIGGSVSSLDSVGNQKHGDLKAEKWKQGARKTLLNWVTNALPK